MTPTARLFHFLGRCTCDIDPDTCKRSATLTSEELGTAYMELIDLGWAEVTQPYRLNRHGHEAFDAACVPRLNMGDDYSQCYTAVQVAVDEAMRRLVETQSQLTDPA